MKALSVMQPWAWAIIWSRKRVENRTWEPPRYIIGQRIAIHASKAVDQGAYDDLLELDIEAPRQLDLGAIIGSVVVTGCVDHYARLPADQQDWWSGPFGWTLADPRRITPIPCRGALGLWEVPAEAMARGWL